MNQLPSVSYGKGAEGPRAPHIKYSLDEFNLDPELHTYKAKGPKVPEHCIENSIEFSFSQDEEAKGPTEQQI